MWPLLTILLLGWVSAIPINLEDEENMTSEERSFYFGSGADMEIGLIRKATTETPLFRNFGSDSNEDNIYDFEAFDVNLKLRLTKNDNVVSKRASIAYLGEDGEEERKHFDEASVNCLRMHKDEKMIAAISNCGDGKLTGFVSTREDTFEITPLTERLKNMLYFYRSNDLQALLGAVGSGNVEIKDLYIVKRAITFPNFTNSDFAEMDDWDANDDKILDLDIEFTETDLPGPNAVKLIETAFFVDHIAYNRFAALYKDSEIEALLLAYINQVHALYHMPSLGQEIDIMITLLEIHRTEQFENHSGDRVPLLMSFETYQASKNPEDDKANPRHWDVAIMLTGIDIWGQENGRLEYSTMGLARTGRMCHPVHSAVVVEFGVWGALGDSYPSTGFSGAYSLAHELGHSLGMRHDGYNGNNKCQSTGFIMSKSRGLRGQTQWSECSSQSLLSSEKLSCLLDRPSTENLKWDHDSNQGYPGYFVTADEQCKFFYHGVDAAVAENSPDDANFCSLLKCRNGDDVRETGPPLEGTTCGSDGASWCKAEQCESILGVQWSQTRSGLCKSGCTRKSTGFREVERVCLVLKGFEHQTCEGEQLSIELCNDGHLCDTRSSESTRRSRTEVATQMCGLHSRFYPQLDSSDPIGKQAKHNDTRPHQGCSVFCQTKDAKDWISPRGIHFSDGTWCHNDGSQDFYCRNHKCLPSDYSFF